jgi:hypothetical protein
MADSVPAHLADGSSGLTELSISRPTAGQRTAADALRAAIAARQPLILLFGDTGSGKTTLLNSVLDTAACDEFVVVSVSATSGEFLGPPTFDDLLEAVCRRLVVPQPAKQRPAMLAALATTVSMFDNERIVLLTIDHADHVTDEVITEVMRLSQYLDISPGSLICVFVGSLGLASRIDSVLRSQGADQRLSEVRLSQPNAEELAALLAYEDTAQPDGPRLTPDAIGRISAYAKSNLHLAVPMADAARSLAESDGKREVTPEMVRTALLEIWSPEQLQPTSSLRSDESSALETSYLSSAARPGLGASAVQGTEEGAVTSPDSPGDLQTPDANVIVPVAFRRRVLGFVVATFVLLIGSSALALVLYGKAIYVIAAKPEIIVQEASPPEPPPNVLPVEPLQGVSEAEGADTQQDQQSQNPLSELWTFILDLARSDPWRPHASGSQAAPTFTTPPVPPNIAPVTGFSWDNIPQDDDISEKNITNKKEKKKMNNVNTSKKWIQTR